MLDPVHVCRCREFFVGGVVVLKSRVIGQGAQPGDGRGVGIHMLRPECGVRSKSACSGDAGSCAALTTSSSVPPLM